MATVAGAAASHQTMASSSADCLFSSGRRSASNLDRSCKPASLMHSRRKVCGLDSSIRLGLDSSIRLVGFVSRLDQQRCSPLFPSRKLAEIPSGTTRAGRNSGDPVTYSSEGSWQLQALTTRLPPWETLTWRVVALWGAGAILGPLLDGRHSQHNVLHYTNPTVLHLGSFFQLESCWWVPLLFGGAAVILGIGHPTFDSLARNTISQVQDKHQSTNSTQELAILSRLHLEPAGGYSPSWSFVLVSIALFALQYDFSGLLAEKATAGQLTWLTVNLALGATAIAHWAVFDRTRNGLFWAALTATIGPVVEIGLIQGLHLYHYTHADVFGIPLWIPWVYWCGAPAVGNLGRRVHASIR